MSEGTIKLHDEDGFSADGTHAFGDEESIAGFGARPSGSDFDDKPGHENPYGRGDVLHRLALKAAQASEESESRHRSQGVPRAQEEPPRGEMTS